MIKNILIMILLAFLVSSMMVNYNQFAELKKVRLDNTDLQQKLENQPVVEKLIVNHGSLSCNQ